MPRPPAGGEQKRRITLTVNPEGGEWLLDTAMEWGLSTSAVMRACLRVARTNEKALTMALEAVRDA